MAEPLVVGIADLRDACNRALGVVEDLLGAEVVLHGGYYWHVPVEDAFDRNNEPRTFTAGQLRDDLDEIASGHIRVPQEAWQELSHLTGVLRALKLTARP